MSKKCRVKELVTSESGGVGSTGTQLLFFWLDGKTLPPPFYVYLLSYLIGGCFQFIVANTY